MKNINKIQTWRRKFKQKIVDSFGGKCGVCGYNKCNDTLHCHHLNADEKEFNMSRIMSNPTKWSKVVPELRKCVLLCSNCHSEVHNGITKIPDNIQKFIESFSIEKEKPTSTCSVCGKEISLYNKTCSMICAAKRAWVVNWESVDLYDLYIIKKIPQTDIGEMLGCSNSAVRKRLKKLKMI